MRASQTGFTYIGLLVAVVLLGLALSLVGTVWRSEARREKEQELLFVGSEFRNAIASYYNANSAGRQYPQSINDLLVDSRWPEPRHHLRRFYADPMTGQQDWNLLRIDGVGIMGIASSSRLTPMKKAGFSADLTEFTGTSCYCDWKFMFFPRAARRRAAAAPPTSD